MIHFRCLVVSAVNSSEPGARCHGRQQHSEVVMETTSASHTQRTSAWISGIDRVNFFQLLRIWNQITNELLSELNVARVQKTSGFLLF